MVTNILQTKTRGEKTIVPKRCRCTWKKITATVYRCVTETNSKQFEVRKHNDSKLFIFVTEFVTCPVVIFKVGCTFRD